MKRFIFLVIAFSFGLFFPFQNQVFSQNSSEETSVGLEFNTNLGSYYFQDVLSTELAGPASINKGLIDIDNYRLGPGDLLSINIKGNQPILLRGLLVNPSGEIVTPLMEPISVNNMSLLEAENAVSNAISKTLRNPSISITLEQPRKATVYITGGVPYPGKYTLPPFYRVDEAIYPSIKKVPTSTTGEEPGYYYTSELLENNYFDFRNITIVRNTGDTLTADLVGFFKTGRLDRNPVVYDGDKLIIKELSTNSPKITVSGAVASNEEIEFKSSDSIEFLIEIAGGYSSEANTKLVYVFRSQNGSISRLEIPKTQWPSTKLQPNDRIVVPKSALNSSATSAEVYGEVELPGYFPIIEGTTTASDILTMAGGLTHNALSSAAYLTRKGIIENQANDKFNVDLMRRTSDQLSQGFEYLEMETRNSQNRVHIDLKDQAQLESLKIYNGDKLFIPRDEQTIFIFGQVNNPGYYPFSTSSPQAISDYIARAGGFALAADQKRIFIIKAGINTWFKPNETKLESGDKIFVDREPYEELNALRQYEVQKQQLKNTRIQLIMTGLTTITSIITAYVAITRN